MAKPERRVPDIPAVVTGEQWPAKSGWDLVEPSSILPLSGTRRRCRSLFLHGFNRPWVNRTIPHLAVLRK
jgi:hypothetical protein